MSDLIPLAILLAGWVVFGTLLGALTERHDYDERVIGGVAVATWPISLPLILVGLLMWGCVSLGEKLRGSK